MSNFNFVSNTGVCSMCGHDIGHDCYCDEALAVPEIGDGQLNTTLLTGKQELAEAQLPGINTCLAGWALELPLPWTHPYGLGKLMGDICDQCNGPVLGWDTSPYKSVATTELWQAGYQGIPITDVMCECGAFRQLCSCVK